MLGEVAPLLVPQFDALLVSLLAVAGCIVALGLVSIIHRVATGTVGTLALVLGVVPGVGHVLASPVNAVVQWMDHEFSAAELELDHLLGRFLHSVADLFAWLGHEIRAHSHLLYVLATVAVGSSAIAWLYRLIRHGREYASSIEAHALGAVRWLHANELRARHVLGAAVSDAAGSLRGEVSAVRQWASSRLRALEHAVGYTLPHELRWLGGRARTVEREAEVLRARVKALERHVTGAGALALVGTALAELGAGWLRCRNVRGVGKHLCGGFGGLLEGLLEDALEALVVADLCQVAGLMQRAAIAFEPVLDELVNAQALICLAGGAGYPSGIERGDLHHGGGLPTAIAAHDLRA